MSDTESAKSGRTEVTAASPRAASTHAGRHPAGAIRPGDVIGRYQIRALLGAGGMGQVFTALDPELDRTVALKLLRPDGKTASSQARTRLLREAQALAKLQHPNVVAIHDVGTQGDQVFIAMERVVGETLAAWLAPGERPWRAIRDVFVAAGRGLVAAHEVGIIHRDFKPSNVIVGADRVVVVDFGLACARGDDSGDDEEAEPASAASVLGLNITLTGERVGTPRYMAPEQHAGSVVTPLVDQFAFATALWEALYRAPPYPGLGAAELLHMVARGLPSAPPSGKVVPDRVRAALVRALAFRPEDRWPSLADLLAELTRDPAARRRQRIAVLAMTAAAIAVPLAFVAGRRAPTASCAAVTSGLWDGAVRAEARSAFIATGKPFAAESFERVDADLGKRVGDWARARQEACAATEIRHEQSAALMDARMECLARSRAQIEAFVGVLRKADGRIVEQSTLGSATVGDIEDCGNGSVLSAVLPPPREPEAAARVAELDRDVARVGAQVLLGRFLDAKAAGPGLVERASALAFPPLLARALYQVGVTGCELGDPREGAATLYQAARAAGAAHDDLLIARVYTKLVFCVGIRDRNAHAGQALAEAAEAALARAGAPPELRARLYRQESRLHRTAGDLVNAFGYAELGLMENQRLYGEQNSEVARSFGDVGGILQVLGGYRGALAAYARGLPILERGRGPNHPAVASHLLNMAAALAEAGEVDDAAAHFARALVIQEQNLGADGIATFLRDLAVVRERQGQLAAARDFAVRARALDEKILRPDHPDLARDLYVLSGIAADRGDLDEADALAEQALAILLPTFGSDSSEVADVRETQALIARQRHDLGTARRFIEAALDGYRKALGPRHPSVAGAETMLGDILIRAGEAHDALPVLEHALAIQEGAREDDAADVVMARTSLAEALLAAGDPGRARGIAERAVLAATTRRQRADIDGRARFVLARMLDTADRARALELARQARASLQGWSAADDVARIDRWLASRP